MFGPWWLQHTLLDSSARAKHIFVLQMSMGESPVSNIGRCNYFDPMHELATILSGRLAGWHGSAKSGWEWVWFLCEQAGREGFYRLIQLAAIGWRPTLIQSEECSSYGYGPEILLHYKGPMWAMLALWWLTVCYSVLRLKMLCAFVVMECIYGKLQDKTKNYAE